MTTLLGVNRQQGSLPALILNGGIADESAKLPSFHHVRGGLFLATKAQKTIYMAKNKLIFMHFLSD